VYWGEPETSSIRYGSDIHIGKPATDIVINGHACASSSSTTYRDVSVQLGQLGKTIRAYGARVWDKGRVSSPEPFESLPLIYENAFGGQLLRDGEIYDFDPRNPVGKGLVDETAAPADGLPLPNIESIHSPIQTPADRPQPEGLGFIAPNWEPRVSLAGTYDSHWQKNRAPYLPEDFNPGFFNMAHPGLVYPGYLLGGEPVLIQGMRPDGDMQFQVPQVKLVSQVFVRNRVENPPFNMETLVIEPDHLRLSMIWKAVMRCDKETLKIRAINVNLSR
jgi:hypothetical protein